MTIACPDCGALEHIPPLPPGSAAVCRLCRGVLEKTSGRSMSAALACSSATLLLLLPANLLPILRVDLAGARRENLIGAGIASLWEHQWVGIAGLTAILVIALPFLRFGLLTAVLGSLRLGYRPRWLGSAFRWAMWLDNWAMSDVWLLASFVGYFRVINISLADVSIRLGGACYMAAGFLTMLSRATLDQRSVWRALAPEAEIAATIKTLSCTTCDLVQPLSRAGESCPRCGAMLRSRKPFALGRPTALLVAALDLYFPANILPMEVSQQLGVQKPYTIFTGVRELFAAGLWPLGVIIFCTSIAIPVGKIAAIGWCIVSVRRRSGAHLLARTKIVRLVAELGRWSNTDPFTIVFFVPLVNFGALGSATAGWGAPAFMAMSVLTMAASSSFDPRLMWDAAPARRT